MQNWQKNLILIWLSQFLAMGGYSMAMPFIPLFIKSRLGITAEGDCGVGVALFNFLGMGMLAIAAPVWGNLADRFGRKLMLLRAAFISAFLFPLMMFAESLWILILIRVAASFFSGTVNAAQTLVASVTPEEKQGFALGAISTAVSTGYMTGFFLGGMVVDKYGFDAGFIICGVCFFLSGLLVLPVKENFVPAVKAPVEGKKHFWELMAGYGTFLRCLIWMILITNFMRSFDNPYLALLVAQSSEPGTAAANTGFISAAAALGGVISGVTIGYLADRFPPRYLLVPLLITAGAMLLCQSFCRNIVLFMVLRFLGFMAAGGIDPVIQRFISSHAGPARRGTVFGVMQGFSVGGVMFSALVSGGVVYLAGVKGVFVTAGILYILCALVAFRILSAGQKSGTPSVGSDV